MSRIRGSWLPALLCLAIGACAFGRAPVATKLDVLDSRDIEARIRLGHVGRFAETPGDEALADTRAAAELSLQLGNLDEASSFAREQLDLARAGLLVERLRGDERSQRAAERELDRAAGFAVDIGDEVLDGRLVIEAAQFMQRLGTRRAAIRRALTSIREADLGWGYERLWDGFAREPARQAELQRLRWRGHSASGLPIGASRLAPEALAGRGAEAVDLLNAEVDRAARDGRELDLERWTRALLDADPHELGAQAIRVVLDALARGELTRDPELLADLAPSGGGDPLGSAARMLVRQHSAPTSRALLLARASAMLSAGGFGDAGQLLVEIEALGSGASEPEQALHDQLAAQVALESGTPAGRAEFQRWASRRSARRSASIHDHTSRHAGHHDQPTASEPARALARAGSHALLGMHRGRALPWLDAAVVEATAIDGDATKRTRERALAAVATDDPSRGARLVLCRERELFDSDCRDLLTELDKLDVADPEYQAGLDALGRSANTRSEWFSSAPWLDAEQLRATRERLAEYEGTRVALTTDFQTAAIFAELAANRPDLARTRLLEHGALLRPETAAVASMALRDLEDGSVQPQELGNLLLELPPADVDASWMLERWLPGDPSMVETLFPGHSRLARFARGLALARMGAWRSATAELLLTLEQMGGAGRAVVAGRLALVAQLADEDELRDRALGVLEVEQPSSFMLPYVRARAAEEIGQNSAAHALYLEALLRRPRATVALDGALRTLPLGKQTRERVGETLALFPDSGVHWQLGELLDLGELDGPTIVRLWLAREDGAEALAIGEPAARWRTTGEAGLALLIDRLEQAPSPDQAFPLAARTLAWLAAMPPSARVQRRELELWLTFLTARTSELEALATARPLRQGLRLPSEATHAALVLAEARDARAVDDAMAWALVRDQLWSSDHPDVIALIRELETTTPADPALAQFACMRLLAHDQHELAAERCVPLWQQLGGSRFLALDLGFLALNEPELLREHGLEPAALFETGATLPELQADPIWLFNHALWLSSQGEHEQAATQRTAQLALGGQFGAMLDDVEYGQVHHRGPLLRQQLIAEFFPGDRRIWAAAAGMALRGLDLRAAQLYAERLLALLPVTDEAPDLTARAPQLLAAERLEGETSDADLRSRALYVRHASALMEDDLATDHIDRPTLHELVEAHADQLGLAAYESVLRRAPESLFAKLLVLTGYREARMREPGVALARELVGLRPHDPLVLSEALPLLTGADDLARARTILAEARTLHPDHPWLHDDALPAVLSSADDRIPDWLRDPDSFDRRLAAIDDATIDALDPVRRFQTQVAAEAFFVGAAVPNPGGELGVRQPIPTPRSSTAETEDGTPQQVDRVQFIVREPRASRCEGLACAEPLIGEWTSRDYALLWVRELEIPAGPAIEFVVTDGESMVDNLLLPTGGNLFVLISGSSPEDFGAFLPAIELLRESFRPLDFTLDAFSAETLRNAGTKLPDDRLRLQARRALARVGGAESTITCPIPEQLATLTPATRGELLLDLLLTSRRLDQRRSLLACTKPAAPEAARLALLTLLDGHAAIHEFGRAATVVHGDRVVDDTRRILFGRPEAAGSDPGLTADGDNPPFGLLQVLAVLPPEPARALTKEMLERSDLRLRSLALAASASIDYFDRDAVDGAVDSSARTDPAKLRERVDEGDASEAIFAAASLLDLPGQANRAALRTRADTLIRAKANDNLSRSLAVELAWAIAQQLDANDRKRLRALAQAIVLAPSDGKPYAAERTHERILAIADDHEAARKLVRASKVATDDESASRWARARRTPGQPRSRQAVAATPLAELLPGTDWTFVRVGNAGLFAASLSELLRRLTPGNAADAYLVRSIINDVLLQGFGLLDDAGGLDLSAGIECASPRGSEGFVCSAKVRDRAALLSELAGRGIGDDAGVTIPLALVTQFAGLPVALGALPVMLHGFIDVPAEDLDSSRAPEIARERLRATRVIAGHALEYYATVELREDSLVVDSEHYLFVDDRVLVFSGAHLAELVLRELPKGNQSLAAAPAFQAASGRWREGMALQAVDLADTFGLDEVAIELVFTSEGLEFSARTRGEGHEARDLGSIAALLPGDPATRLAAVMEPDDLRESFEDAELERCSVAPSESEPEPCGLRAGELLPPLELAEAAAALAIGWYGDPSDELGLWQHWVLVLPIDAALRKAMSAAKLPALTSDSVVAHEGRFWLARDGALIIASNQALADQARQQPSPAPLAAGERRPFVAGAMHGQRAAKLVRALAGRFEGERRAELLRIFATMLGLIGEVEITGGWDRDGDGTLQATLGLNLAKSDEELALIDRWLADTEVGNALPLPRHLTSADTERPLELVIRVDDAEEFARTALPSNPRISVAVIADDRLRVKVLPSKKLTAHAGPTTLSKDQRSRALGSDERVRADTPAIREVAEALIVEGDSAATVQAVVTWVHERIRYEITPTSLDALAVLDRGKGDCTEYALLTVTLLRAAGIPAELREGMSMGGDEMVAHAWAAWHDGERWNEIDPTAGTTSVGAGHLEIEVVDVLALISLGRFEILELTPVL